MFFFFWGKTIFPHTPTLKRPARIQTLQIQTEHEGAKGQWSGAQARGPTSTKAKKREQPRAESRVNSETGEGGWASGGGGGNKGPLGPACGRGWLHNGRGGTAYVRVRQAVL